MTDSRKAHLMLSIAFFVAAGILLTVVYFVTQDREWTAYGPNFEQTALVSSLLIFLFASLELATTIFNLITGRPPNIKITLSEREEDLVVDSREALLHEIETIQITNRLAIDPQTRHWIPLNLSTQQPNGSQQNLPSMIDVFDESGRSLLILGEPESGKTIKLLQLTEQLIARAQADDTYPIPVVLDLAKWPEMGISVINGRRSLRRYSISEWLKILAADIYHCPAEFIQSLAENNQLIPLLDGLDMMSREDQIDCARALNDYCADKDQVVVCCRQGAYEWLEQAGYTLNLTGRMIVQPVTPKQIVDHLAGSGLGDLVDLQTLEQDRELLEFMQSPLLLNLAVQTFQEMSSENLPDLASLKDRRGCLFEACLERVFRHQAKKYSWSDKQIRHWLAWLARKMDEQKAETFLIEHLQSDWLEKKFHKIVLLVTAVLINGLIVGLAGWLGFGLIGGLVGGIIGGLLGGVEDASNPMGDLRQSWADVKMGLYSIMGGCLLFVGLGSGVIIGLFMALFGKLLGWQHIGPFERFGVGLTSGLFTGLFGVLFAGPFYMLYFGGSAIIRHIILRFILWCKNFIPWQLGLFLEHATELGILRRVGKGYKFTHPLLMEHFAAMGNGK